MVRFLQPRVPWLLGFLLMANLYLVPTVAASPRATDLLGLLLGVWILRRLASGRQPAGPLVLMSLVCLLPLAWFGVGLLHQDTALSFQTVRWLLAAPWAMALAAVLDTPENHRRFAWGVVWGGWLGVGVILLQWLGLESLLRLVGLSSSDSAYYHYVFVSVRLPGLHGQHNASATVISLALPAVYYLYFRWRCSLLVVLATLAGFLVALHLTSTRSPLIVAIPTTIYAFVAAREVGRGAVIGLVLLAVVVPLVLVYGPPGGWTRWNDTNAIGANYHERLTSNATALEMALERPQGYGVTRGKELLFERSGVSATHNAFLQAAIYLGLPLGLALLVAMTALVLRGFAGRDGPLFLESLLACQTAGVFLFEEHLNNPTFVILACWFLVAATTHLQRRTTAPAAAPDGPLSSA